MLFLYAIAFSVAYISLSAGTGALILFASVQITMITVGLYDGERPDVLEWLGLMHRDCRFDLFGISWDHSPFPVWVGSHGHCRHRLGHLLPSGPGRDDPVGATADNFLRTVPLALAVVFLWSSRLTISPMGLLWAVLSGSITSGLGYVIWYAALRGLTATRAATVQLSVPVLAALGGVVVLSEAITLRLIISAVVILSGVGLAVAHHKTVADRQGSTPRVAHGSIKD